MLTDTHLEAYETALDHFLAGRWPEAFRYLHLVPAEDQVKDFLTVYIASTDARLRPIGQASLSYRQVVGLTNDLQTEYSP